MTRWICRSLVAVVLAGIGGCTASVEDAPRKPGSSGSGGSGGGGTVTPGGTGGGNGSGGSGGPAVPGTGGSVGGTGNTTGTSSCVPGVPATTQIPRMTALQYETVVKDLLGVTTLTTAGNALPSSLLAPDSAGSLTAIAWNGYLKAAETIAAEVMAGPNKSKFITCDPAAAGCLADTIKAFGRKAFRRPLSAAEVTSFERLNSVTPKGTPAEVAEAILYAFLVSPSFITLPELAAEKEGSYFKLTGHEIATRLSFLLWNSIPDDMLNAAADGGQLTTKEQIRAQAERMLQSPKAAAVAKTFHRFYADIQPGTHWVNNITHDATKFPSFTAATYSAGMTEIDAFFQEVLLGGGTFKDLFLSNVGFVTKDTATLYGLNPASYGTMPTKVTLDATKRPGFLTRIGFLSTFSHHGASSPILRGAFISGRVLGIPTGTPDPSFIGKTPPQGNYKTNREAMEALTSPAPCNSCHTGVINPPGFVLERYNAIGTWQDTDALGGAINSTAEVMISPNTKKTITSPAELMAEIAAAPNAQRTYAQHWVAFASGRSPNPNDACIVDQLAGRLANPSTSIAGMMADFTQADSFRLRAVGN